MDVQCDKRFKLSHKKNPKWLSFFDDVIKTNKIFIFFRNTVNFENDITKKMKEDFSFLFAGSNSQY